MKLKVAPYHSMGTKGMALMTEGGEVLPRQKSLSIDSVAGHALSVTVTFLIDGEHVYIEGYGG